MNNILIRKATDSDLPIIEKLIIELIDSMDNRSQVQFTEKNGLDYLLHPLGIQFSPLWTAEAKPSGDHQILHTPT